MVFLLGHGWFACEAGERGLPEGMLTMDVAIPPDVDLLLRDLPQGTRFLVTLEVDGVPVLRDQRVERREGLGDNDRPVFPLEVERGDLVQALEQRQEEGDQGPLQDRVEEGDRDERRAAPPAQLPERARITVRIGAILPGRTDIVPVLEATVEVDTSVLIERPPADQPDPLAENIRQDLQVFQADGNGDGVPDLREERDLLLADEGQVTPPVALPDPTFAVDVTDLSFTVINVRDDKGKVMYRLACPERTSLRVELVGGLRERFIATVPSWLRAQPAEAEAPATVSLSAAPADEYEGGTYRGALVLSLALPDSTVRRRLDVTMRLIESDWVVERYGGLRDCGR